MTDFRAALSALSRPRLLVRAARFGIADYRRDRDLRRLSGSDVTEIALPRLIEAEAAQETRRLAGDASYSVTRHVELLIALMAEVRCITRAPLSLA